MKIDRNINLVLTVDRDSGPTHVHAIPLREEVFDIYFLILSQTWADMTALGGEWMIRMGPRNASRMLKRRATTEGVWEGLEGVERGFLAEIRRTSSAIVGTPSGWESVPLQEALDRKYFTASDVSEVENALTFFTLGSACESPTKADSMMSAVFGLFGAQLTSLNCTAFQASLPTSTQAANIGEKVKASSMPL